MPRPLSDRRGVVLARANFGSAMPSPHGDEGPVRNSVVWLLTSPLQGQQTPATPTASRNYTLGRAFSPWSRIVAWTPATEPGPVLPPRPLTCASDGDGGSPGTMSASASTLLVNIRSVRKSLLSLTFSEQRHAFAYGELIENDFPVLGYVGKNDADDLSEQNRDGQMAEAAAVEDSGSVRTASSHPYAGFRARGSSPIGNSVSPDTASSHQKALPHHVF